MSDQIYWACAETLTLAVQLPAANLPPAAELRQRLTVALDSFVAKGRSAGLSDVDLAEARYALTAFIDEQILKSSWPGRAEWMNQPLQLVFYREYTAGENFFNRMRALLQRGSSPALQIYYLCLALGFRGAYGVSGDVQGLSSLMDAARGQVSHGLPPASKLGPHALPKDRVARVRDSNAVLFAMVGACLFVTLAVAGGLAFALRSDLKQALTTFPETAASAAPDPAVKAAR